MSDDQTPDHFVVTVTRNGETVVTGEGDAPAAELSETDKTTILRAVERVLWIISHRPRRA